MSILSQFKQSQNTDFPNVRPSLDLRFALAKKLDPRITFTRGSTGTYFGPDGLMRTAGVNEPRFDHDPITGQSLGLMVEESRVNSWLYSGQNVTTGWSFTPTTISFDNTQTTPDGSTNTIKFTERAIYTGGMGFSQTLSVTSGTSYTFSIFAKQPDNSPLRYLSILLLNTGFGEIKLATFNPKNGAVLYTTGTLTTSVQKYPNGWWRFSVTGTATVTTTSEFSVRFTNSISFSVGGGPYGNYTGDGSSFLYFYGPQVENGAFMTSFIPTTASTVTRSADNASMTGTNFSSWYNQGEGTLYANAKSNTNSFLPTGVAAINNSSSPTANRVDLRYYQSGSSQNTFNGVGGGGSSIFRTSGFSLTNPKFVVSYASQNVNFCVNSSLTSSRASAFVPSPLVNRLIIGNFDSGTIYYLNGTISRLTYYPIQLTNQQLINLTS